MNEKIYHLQLRAFNNEGKDFHSIADLCQLFLDNEIESNMFVSHSNSAFINFSYILPRYAKNKDRIFAILASDAMYYYEEWEFLIDNFILIKPKFLHKESNLLSIKLQLPPMLL